jgi:hypothetical protein
MCKMYIIVSLIISDMRKKYSFIYLEKNIIYRKDSELL